MMNKSSYHAYHYTHQHSDQKVISSASDEIIYTCPMHPELFQNYLGVYPIYDMALESKRITNKVKYNEELIDMRYLN